MRRLAAAENRSKIALNWLKNRREPMKAFIAACAALVLIAVCAAVVLDSVNKSADQAFVTTGVRI
jgi:hypothetical protein